MKKEVIIAIIIGISIGLIITFGVHTARQSLKSQPEDSTSSNTQAQQPTSNQSSHSLFLTTPQPDTVVDENPLMITGSTTPGAMIGVLVGSYYNMTTADDQGNFSVLLDLKTGANLITVTSYDLDGQSASENVKVVYASPDLEKIAEAKTTPTPTPKKPKPSPTTTTRPTVNP